MLPYHSRRSSSKRSRAAVKPAEDGLLARLSAVIIYTLFFLCITPIAMAILYRYVPPPVTPLMLIRLAQGHAIHKTWMPLTQISPALRQSVIASEDNLFCEHNGFDWKAIDKAIDQWQDGNPSGKGGSTISQQTAKNVFLVPNRALWRKALEAPLTVLIEHLWPKQRILEIYLNIAEWAPGVYGAEAASRYYFHTSARNLTRPQAALLAAVLPSPLHWSASRPGPYVASRGRAIQRRVPQLDPAYTACSFPLLTPKS